MPSGSWRCRVFWYTDKDGKQHYKSFTCQDPSQNGKRICEAEAAMWAMNKPQVMDSKQKIKRNTFADALDKYIRDRENILSPSSIRKYRGLQKNHFQELRDIPLNEIGQDDIQQMINRMVKENYSSKMINDVSCMVSTILKTNNINPIMNTVKPKKKRKQVYVPSTDDIVTILRSAKGTDMELPIMLGAFAGMRRGEISALDVSDLNGQIIHVHKNMVMDPEGKWLLKDPKTEAGDRYVKLAECIIDLLPKEGNVTNMTPNVITSKFEHVLKRAGVQHFRFHDLRHWNTSVKHNLGVSDAVIQAENGWSRGDDKIMKEVYRHTLAGHEYADVAVDFFDNMTRNMTRN